MTPAQNNRVIGFAMSLKTRGVPLALRPGGQIFQALIEPAANYKLRKTQTLTNEKVSDVIHARRSDVAEIENQIGAAIRVGSVFVSGNKEFRVVDRHDDAANVVSIEFHCQSSKTV